jgi:SAM-dependent methyltransferase
LGSGIRVLDIGSSRGQFLAWSTIEFPANSYVGIEKDPTIAATEIAPNVEVLVESLIDSKVDNLEKFDFIFCNHSLEHFDDAIGSLRYIRKLLAEDGILWIDVPNMIAIKDLMVVEEFFIDKHMYHFDHVSLENILRRVGLVVVEDHSDDYNLVFLVKKIQPNQSLHTENVVSEKDLFRYEQTLNKNREKLKKIASKISSIENVAIYGSGRILDALIKYGELQVNKFLVADKFLWEHAGNLGIEISNPESVDWSSFENVVVLARSSENEIVEWLTSKGAKSTINLEELWRD